MDHVSVRVEPLVSQRSDMLLSGVIRLIYLDEMKGFVMLCEVGLRRATNSTQERRGVSGIRLGIRKYSVCIM